MKGTQQSYDYQNKRISYYEGNCLIVQIGTRKYRYPPKGGVLIFDKSKKTKLDMTDPS